MLRYCWPLLLFPSIAWAQTAPAGPTASQVAQQRPASRTADKARVVRKTYLKCYAVPVVSVPDAGVTARMARYFSLRNLAGSTEAALAADIRKYEGCGPVCGMAELQGLKYTINYNDRGVLSITSTRSGVGRNMWAPRQNFNIDLHTGARLTIAEELQPERLPELLALGEQKLSLIVQAYLTRWPDMDFLAKDERLHFTRTTLMEYRLTARGLVFDATNVAALPRKSAAGESQVDFIPVMGKDLEIEFSYAELAPLVKPGSPLQRLLSQAAPPGGASAR